MKEISIYILIIIIVAFIVFINYKKGQKNFRSRRNKSFRDSYLEKKKKKETNENLH